MRERFAGRILDVTPAVAETWGDLLARRKRAGATLPVLDALLAATALAHAKTLVTRNVHDFVGCGTPVLNPWTGETFDP